MQTLQENNRATHHFFVVLDSLLSFDCAEIGVC